MSVYLGKNKVGITKYEDLDTELNEQETLLNDLEADVNALSDKDDTALKILDGTLEEFDNNQWGLTSLRMYQFKDFNNLKKIDLTGITEIPTYAFYMCKKAEDIVIDTNTSFIDNYGLSFGNSDLSTPFVFETNVQCSLGEYALYKTNVSKIKGRYKLGTASLMSCNKLTTIDIDLVGTLPSYALRDCQNVQSLKINFENITSTTINSYFAQSSFSNRPNPENNVFDFDMRKTSITTIENYALGGQNASVSTKFVRFLFPRTLTNIKSYFLQYSDNCTAYFSGLTPATLGTGSFRGSTNYKIFVPYNAVNAYKVATNWTTHADYIYGWAEENTFEQGATLPKYSAEGYELTWYSDENMTTVVTTVDDATKMYYCTIGTEQVDVIGINSIITTDANVSIVDTNGTQYSKGDYIPVGTQLTITATPTIEGYIPYIQTFNDVDFTTPYTHTTISGTNIDIIAIYWNGVDLPADKDFSKNSWYMIKQVIQSGKAGDYWSVGDVKEIEIDGLTYGVRLADLQAGRYNYADGTRTTNAVLEFVQLYNTTYRMNATNTNAGGWAECELRTTLNETILSKFPADLQSLLEDVIIASANGGYTNYTAITTSNNKLFIPCAKEINILAENWSFEGEGTVWDYYIGAENTLRIKSIGEQSGVYWRLRSPHPSSVNSFTIVGGNGAAGGTTNSTASSGGICPCFAW